MSGAGIACNPESFFASLLTLQQQEVDGGGFKIFADTPDYLFVQFESVKSGFIDDVEFAINPDGEGILWR